MYQLLMPIFKTFILIFIVIYVMLILSVLGKDVVIKSKDTTVVFAYRTGIEGESGLDECKSNEACNIVHNRFWLPTLTERLCRCSGGRECPWNWNYMKTSNSSGSSMTINNRSVLQFCSSTQLENMKICSSQESAITVLGKGDPGNSFLHPYSVKANCKCENQFFWKLQKVKYIEDKELIFQVYKCAKQWMCDSLEFCGHVRADLFSVYYRCTCPEKHWCIFMNKTQQQIKYHVQELVYTGTAYKAYCIPHT